MSGIEFLNIKSHRDIPRIRRGLREQATQQHLQAADIYRFYLPELHNWVAAKSNDLGRLQLSRIYIDAAELLMEDRSKDAARESKVFLQTAIRLFFPLTSEAGDPNLWRELAKCYHLLVECSLRLGDGATAEQFSLLAHSAYRQVSRCSGGRVSGYLDKDALPVVYADLMRTLSASEDPARRVLGQDAQLRLRRFNLWVGTLEMRDRRLELVIGYHETGLACQKTDDLDQKFRALDCYRRALALALKHKKQHTMRRHIMDIYLDMGRLCESMGGEGYLLKAKKCYVNALDAALEMERKSRFDAADPEIAREALVAAFEGLAQVCWMLPGTKNKKKAKEYRRKAESIQ